jgi:hypothetical protein
MYLLPYPIENYLPKLFRDYPDAGYNALVAKANGTTPAGILGWYQEIIGLQWLKNPLLCPGNLLTELGYLVGANFTATDTETIKRQKIATAALGNKTRGSWTSDIKPAMDAITSYSAVIYTTTISPIWSLLGNATVPAGNYWSSLGGISATDGYGLYLLGVGDEVDVAGNIYINCHYGVTTAVLSAGIITAIRAYIMSDCYPAYLRIKLGYLDGTGAWVTYTNGVL